MRQPDISASVAARPIREPITRAIRSLGDPEHRRPNGMPKSDVLKNVAKGATHPCRQLELIVIEEHAAGTPLESVRAIPRLLDFAIRKLWGAIPDATDLRAALYREQRAQCAVDPVQMKAFASGDATDGDLELLLSRLEEQGDATEALTVAVLVELARRSAVREISRRRLTA